MKFFGNLLSFVHPCVRCVSLYNIARFTFDYILNFYWNL